MPEKICPGPNTAKESKRAKRLIAPTTQNFDFALGRARGVTSCWVMDEDGEKYFDAHSGPGVFNIGHRHPALEEVKRTAVFGYGANEYPSYESNELAKRLASLSPGNFDKKVFFSALGEGLGGSRHTRRPGLPPFAHNDGF